MVISLPEKCLLTSSTVLKSYMGDYIKSTSWKSVLLGAAVSQDREEWCIQSALKLCNNLTDGNVKALERLSQLKQGANLSRLEQLCVAESLRQEEQRILEHARVVLQNLQRQ
ncbi:SET domain-containing protein 4 [Anabarilius grahami]|uniref:SET domain-containing protein 4 n=1 Tax=Anabarilius grahami TaxID=495550 RepID=A0A3N0YJQ8_ANAGA|nr:SET domain-containing protein 4 [Anabarilius grahami]